MAGMTTFADSCAASLTESAQRVEAGANRPRATRLLRVLKGKKKVLVTAHAHPDPDALATSQAMAALLRATLPTGVVVEIRFKGQLGGGLNAGFTRLAEIDALSWDDEAVAGYDAIILVDCQPGFANNPLPPGAAATAIVDHHRGRGRRPQAAYVDIRPEVGATASILFSYFMELQTPIPRELAAPLLFAIESDLAGAAGQQAGLDTIAISNLTLLADARKLSQMRYVRLPEDYYTVFADAIDGATRYDDIIVSHLGEVRFAEIPAVMADFLLRCQGVNWVMVTARHDGRFIFSLRTATTRQSAGEVARRLTRGLGDGGGHKTKAGGAIPIVDCANCSAECDCLRGRLRKRFFRALRAPACQGHKIGAAPAGATR